MSKKLDNILFPNYNKSILNIPSTVLNLFGASVHHNLSINKSLFKKSNNWDRVILFLIDGFGVKQWKKHKDNPKLAQLSKNTYFNTIHSIYPSETAAAVASIHTGLSPQKHV